MTTNDRFSHVLGRVLGVVVLLAIAAVVLALAVAGIVVLFRVIS